MNNIYKKILFTAVILIMSFQYSSAQDSLKNSQDSLKKISPKSERSDVHSFISLQGTYVRHLGHFSDVWSYTTGAYAGYNFYFPGNYVLSLKTGYLKVHNREGTSFPANSGANIVPLIIGGKYLFNLGNIKPYLSFNNGGNLIFQKVDFEGEKDEKSMFKYYWQAGAGALINLSDKMKIDVSANLNSHFYQDTDMMTGLEYMVGLEYKMY